MTKVAPWLAPQFRACFLCFDLFLVSQSNITYIHILLYLPSAESIARWLVGPSKELKLIIQTEHNIVKIRNWPEANHLASYLNWRTAEGLNSGQSAYLEKIYMLKPHAQLNYKTRHSSALGSEKSFVWKHISWRLRFSNISVLFRFGAFHKNKIVHRYRLIMI